MGFVKLRRGNLGALLLRLSIVGVLHNDKGTFSLRLCLSWRDYCGRRRTPRHGLRRLQHPPDGEEREAGMTKATTGCHISSRTVCKCGVLEFQTSGTLDAENTYEERPMRHDARILPRVEMQLEVSGARNKG